MSRAQRLAFVTPRFSETATIGGAETLIKSLALHAAQAGRDVTLLTTCATDHFTWKNERPPGRAQYQGIKVEFFPVDEDRDVEAFHAVQSVISRGSTVSEEEERVWLGHNVNSRALCAHLQSHKDEYDAIIVGPYLFGLIYHAAQVCPKKTHLVPCLHDEPFARLSCIKELFEMVAGLLFNTEPERDLAYGLYSLPEPRCNVVGMGMDVFTADDKAFAQRHRLSRPYILYSGRREPMKGTPLLIDYFHAFRERTGQDIGLVLTGSGPLEIPVELTPYVLDIGFVSEEEKREAMAGALAFVHPSVNESFGIVLLESWIAGTPALVHAGSEVLRWQCQRSGGGLWFRHYPDFEEALCLLLHQSPVRKQLGDAGRAYVQREYAWPIVERKLFKSLANVINTPPININ